ncbi:MFS transporter [Streptomyces vinaceus]|uniref:MFS transporter n=1 Tax=Streptomyces vinaceus TaxID=1960 RepID=UPI00380BC2C5
MTSEVGSADVAGDDSAEENRPRGSMRHFWIFTGASAVSKLGNTFLNFAMPWILLSVTGSGVIAALSFGVQLAPYALSPVLGVVVDRFNRRRLFIWCEVAQCVMVGLLPLVISDDSVLPVLALLFLIGCGGLTSELTSDFGLIPALAPADGLAKAYSRYTTTISLVRFVGPALVGVVIGSLGPSGALWIDAGTFLVTAAAAMSLPLHTAEKGETGAFRKMLTQGLSSFWHLRKVRRLTAAMAVYNLGAGAVPTVLVVIAQTRWHWSPETTGVVLGLGALGAAAGAWVAPRIARERGLQQRIGLWFGVCALGGVLLLFGHSLALVTGFILSSMGAGGMNVTTNEYRFNAIPNELLGRVNAVIRAAVISGAALSSVILGYTVSLDDPFVWMAPVAVGALIATVMWSTQRAQDPPNPEL